MAAADCDYIEAYLDARHQHDDAVGEAVAKTWAWLVRRVARPLATSAPARAGRPTTRTGTPRLAL